MNRLGSKHVASAPVVPCAQASSVDLTCHQKFKHQSYSRLVSACQCYHFRESQCCHVVSLNETWLESPHQLGKPMGTPADPEVQTLGFH